MAAGDFTASALQVGQIRLGEMFATPNIAQTELLKGSASTARALLAKNKSRTVPRLVGDKCVGVEAYYELDLTDKIVRSSRMTTYGAQVFVRCKIFGQNVEEDRYYPNPAGGRRH